MSTDIDAFDTAIELGELDVLAGALSLQVNGHLRMLGGPSIAAQLEVGRLVGAVYLAATPGEAAQPLAELRSIVTNLDAGKRRTG